MRKRKKLTPKQKKAKSAYDHSRLEILRSRRLENPGKEKERNKKRYWKNPEAGRGKARQARLKNPVRSQMAAEKYRKSNREIVLERTRVWRKLNPEKSKAATKRWRKNNRDKVRASVNKHSKKLEATPRGSVEKSIRTLMGQSLKKSPQKKAGRHWEEIAGYGFEKLKEHLELNFLPGMSWGNRDKWHVDHIIPLASWDYDGPDHPEFKAAWGLGNLRPVWKERNLSKNKYLPTLDELRSHKVKGRDLWTEN